MPFSIEDLRRALRQPRIVFRIHALQRMFSRAISREELMQALDGVQVIEDYPDEKPYASALLLGFTHRARPLHVVGTLDEEEQLPVLTVYEPDTTRWAVDRKTRRTGK